MFRGYEKARSPAQVRRVPACLNGHKGTLFLDEVGELPLEIQAVYCILQEGRVIRLGAEG